ncbi:hypothetical protein Pse7367_0650 [Thalassoporum mexicanum PCC 7367]|uniref:hypothetical protein n=1 Tax=Thalassoporum mexicanum TaxID=3457544 RepID=UPI00029FDC8D|nr:hypothetical protein [Pseudanabaena sp. PCC 7367]AFY68953.1 hypothetical protein Pse7367_0650 [Pseudanabaena sp. PCC 7367]
MQIIDSSRMEHVEALVTSLKHFSKANGDRVYAVFELPSGQQCGIWSAIDNQLLINLQVGDRVVLGRSPQGRFKMIRRQT